MFFYLFHNLNHGLFHTKEKSDGATNVRTMFKELKNYDSS